jgi:peroxiredoxin Q/BCP
MAGILEVGKKAPAFRLKNKDGKTVSLSDYKGKWVVLYFYPKDNTSGCTKEAIAFSELKKDFEKEDAVILGVSPDSEASHEKFVNKHNLTIELLSDPDKKMLEKYGVWQEKSMYGKKYMGVARTTYLINPAGKVEEVWEKVKVNGHADAVKEKLCSLG